ncbi:ABC transporter-related protein [Fischerella sp. NIES-4106]|nr:ABC transporter-related protein [Fischerella sp. NIES-4106]
MSDSVIRVENLSKKYVLSHQQEGQSSYKSLREVVSNGAKSLGKKLLKPSGKEIYSRNREEFWALKDVSFEIKQGDCVGIIGRNGAGKSTLLKIISRITEPTSGSIRIKGRVASLLEVGTGFHPELTGRENIFLNGAILGMSKVEIKRKFDEIVDFAEIEKFLDTPVKRYSSGMYVRLAFAVAAHLEPEILIVDEVLAVGDAQFQKKCLGKMGDVSTKEGRTVFFVSHNMAAITKLCSKALFLKSGQLLYKGDCAKAVQMYMSSDTQSNTNDSGLDFSRRRVKPNCVEIVDAWLQRNGQRVEEFIFGDTETEVVIVVKILQQVCFSVELLLRDAQDIPVAFSPSGFSQDCEFDGQPGSRATIVCKLPPLRLAQGKYSLDLMLAMSGVKFFDYIESGISFIIVHTAIGNRNWSFAQSTGQGCFLWDVQYSINSKSVDKLGSGAIHS